MDSRTPHKVVSFFAGCGGLDLGFLGGFRYKDSELKRLPFHIEAAFDFDNKCVSTYNCNIGDHAYVMDLAQSNSEELPSSDLLVGGFPCQDFSSCGPKAGLTSTRGQLYQTLVSYMMVHKPKMVVAENVPHIAKIGGGSVLETIIRDLEETGYHFEVWRLFAPDFGVPQNRLRLFFIGVRNDVHVAHGFPEIPRSTHDGIHRSIDWAIGDLEGIIDETVPNQSQYFKASKAKNGNGQGDEMSRAGLPSYTVRANAKSRVQFHYKLPRRLTVRECARLQTFPDDFVFKFSATTNIMQIGNAVPPLLANNVAASIASFMNKIG